MTKRARRSVAQIQKDQEFDNALKLINEIKMMIGGSAAYEYKGLLERQREDDLFKIEILKKIEEGNKEILEKIEQTKKDGKEASRALDKRLSTIEGYFSIVTNKTMWKIFGFVLIILLLVSNWTRDLYIYLLTYIKKAYL